MNSVEPTKRHPLHRNGASDAAGLFGSFSAEPIWASGLKAPRNQAGHMTASRRSERQKKHLHPGGRSLIASPLSRIFLVAAPGHGSLRGRNNPPQHLVRSTGAAMSTTSWHTMTPLKAHSRSHPYPRPAGNHYIRNLARMNLTNNGVRRLLRAPTSGTALPNARHYAR
jgi:hypothetical protein